MRFRVETKPVEVQEERLTLADLDTLGEQRPRAQLRVTLAGEGGRPLPKKKVFLYVSGRAEGPIPLTTNDFGEVEIDPIASKYRIAQRNRRPLLVSFADQPTYFVHCTCPEPELQSDVIRLSST